MHVQDVPEQHLNMVNSSIHACVSTCKHREARRNHRALARACRHRRRRDTRGGAAARHCHALRECREGQEGMASLNDVSTHPHSNHLITPSNMAPSALLSLMNAMHTSALARALEVLICRASPSASTTATQCCPCQRRSAGLQYAPSPPALATFPLDFD
jgi:hypothetical protein